MLSLVQMFLIVYIAMLIVKNKSEGFLRYPTMLTAIQNGTFFS